MAEQKFAEIGRLNALYKQDQNEAHLHAQFHIIDEDGNGSITVGEWKTLLQVKLGEEAEMAAEFFVALGDKNDDGVLSLEEYVALVKRITNS